MNFTELLIRRPVLSIVMTIIILMVGAVSYSRLSLRQFPEVDKPIISVTTSLEGASPQIIEQQVTRPIEEALGGIEGLDYITSRSETENSVVKLNFRSDRDIDLAAADVRDRLQKVQGKLQEDVSAALKRQNVKKPAGRLTGEEREFMVTTTSTLSTPSQFNNMIILQKEGRIVYLKDVGHAELKSQDPRTASRFNDHNAVSIGI